MAAPAGRSRIVACLTSAVAAAAVLFPAPASASTRGDAWHLRAVTAHKLFRDGGSERVYAYAAMAEASGRLYGWTHSYTSMYLGEVYARRNPDGGWGIGEAYDAFNDGSTNPADTTYAVTLADHVGPTLLAGYQAGVVARADVQGIVDMLMTMPRVPVAQGQCVAYSTQAADAQPGYCVHNVNAGVAYFLGRAAAAGVTAPGGEQLAADITVQEVAAYQPAPVAWWPYLDGSPTLQDADHEAYSAQSMHALAEPVGSEAATEVMTHAYPDQDTSPLAHMRLTSTPGTGWCELGDQWLQEASDYILPPQTSPWFRPPPPPALRLAQAAMFSARAAEACP